MNDKPDLDKYGVFKQLSYITVGDPYVEPSKLTINFGPIKGRQMFGLAEKSKSGLNHGYFSEFQRVFHGESNTDMFKISHSLREESKKMNIAPVFRPPNGTKLATGSGSYIGTFSGPLRYFSSASKDQPYQPAGRNIYTNPLKKGTGFGYTNVTIGKFPPYVPSPYEVGEEKKENAKHRLLVGGRSAFVPNGHVQYFGPDPYKGNASGKQEASNITMKPSSIDPPFRPSNPPKLPGGSCAGNFSPFPKHMAEPYIDPYRLEKHPKEVKSFVPSSGPKSVRSESIMLSNIKKRINRSNFGTVVSVMPITVR